MDKNKIIKYNKKGYTASRLAKILNVPKEEIDAIIKEGKEYNYEYKVKPAEVIARYKEGYKPKEIAEMYEISKQRVYKVLEGILEKKNNFKRDQLKEDDIKFASNAQANGLMTYMVIGRRWGCSDVQAMRIIKEYRNETKKS